MIPGPDGSTWTSTGITLTYLDRAGSNGETTRSGWHASLDFDDAGFNNDDADAGHVSTEGKLHSRYAVSDGSDRSGIEVVLDTLLADAEQLGITFVGTIKPVPFLYYRGDGEDQNFPLRPTGWSCSRSRPVGSAGRRTGERSLSTESWHERIRRLTVMHGEAPRR